MAQRDDAAGWLQSLESQLNQGRLFSHQTSLADIALLPFVRQFALPILLGLQNSLGPIRELGWPGLRQARCLKK